MRRRWRILPKLVAIVGGFLILVGIIMLGIAFLAIFGYLNVGVLLDRKYLLTFALAMVAVGLLDTFTAVIIVRW